MGKGEKLQMMFILETQKCMLSCEVPQWRKVAAFNWHLGNAVFQSATYPGNGFT